MKFLLVLSICICFSLIAGDSQMIPGIEKSAYGYNIFKGNPLSPVNDPGISQQIFSIDYKQNRTTGKYAVPDYMTLSRDVRCNRYADSEIALGMTSYQKQLEQSIGGTISYDGYSFSPSIDFIKKTEGCRSKNYTYTNSKATCQIYYSQWDTFQTRPLTDNFVAAVAKTNFDDKEQLYDFIEAFGTSYNRKIFLGAYSSRQTAVEAQAISLMKSLDIDVKLAASFTYDKINGQVQEETHWIKTNSWYWANTVQESSELYIGAMMPKIGESIDWQNLVEDDITTIKMELDHHIDNLLTSEYFPDDKDIEHKQQVLSKSYDDYCKSRYNNCTFPDPDPEIDGSLDQLSLLAAGQGGLLKCMPGNALVGTCGSGALPGCNGHYHHEMCSSRMEYPSNNTEEFKGFFGKWNYCSKGAITSICRAGSLPTCKLHYQSGSCNLDIPTLAQDCYYEMGGHGKDLYCNDGYVATGTCNSGPLPSCNVPKANGAYWVGLYCCPIGNANNGHPVWALPKPPSDLQE